MIPAFSPFLARRYLVTRKINILGVFGVAFAVWAMLVVDGVFTGFVRDIQDNVRSSAPPLLLTDLPHDSSYDPLRDALEADDDVVITAPRLRHHAMIQPLRARQFLSKQGGSSQLEFDHTANGFALLIGIDPARELQVVDLPGWLDRGTAEIQRRAALSMYTTVLQEDDPERLANMLVKDRAEWQGRRRAGLPVDDNPENHRSQWPGMIVGWRRAYHLIWVREGTPFEVVSAAYAAGGASDADGNSTAALKPHSLRVAFAGWFSAGSRMFDEATALLPIETVRTLLGQTEYDLDSIPVVTDVAIRPRDGMTAAELVALQRRLEQKVQPLLPAGSPNCSVLDWREQNSVYLRAVAQEHAMMQIVLFIVMLVSAFVIYATLHMMVTQKVKDIGIVAAVGGSPAGIGTVFFLGGTVVGVLGSLLGVTAGILSALWINPVNDWFYKTFKIELFPREMFDLQGVPCHLEPSWVVSVAIGAIVLAVVVALIPARKAARMNPVTALSFE